MPYKLNQSRTSPSPWGLVLASVTCALVLIGLFLYFADPLSRIGGAL